MDFQTLPQDADRAEIVAMGEQVVSMFRHVREAFLHLDSAPLGHVSGVAQQVHRQERALIDRMVRRSAWSSSLGGGAEEEAVFIPMHLDRVAGNIELLGAEAARALREGALFTDRARREIGGLLDTVLELLEGLHDALQTGNRTLVRYILDEGRDCETRANEYALFHEQRLIEGVCQPKASSIYLAMLDHLRGIEWHARQVAHKLAPALVAPDTPPGYVPG